MALGYWLEKLLQIAAHVVQADRIDRHHAHPAGNFLVQRAHLVFQGVVALHQLAAALVVGLALGRKHEGALGAIDQLDAQPALELVDDLAGPGLGNAVFVGCREKLLPADDVTKDLQRFQLHGRRVAMSILNREETQDLNRTC